MYPISIQKKMKKNNKYKIVFGMVFTMLALLSACKYDVIPIPPGPFVAKATDSLNAVYVKTPPTSVSSPLWATLNYHPVNCVNLSTGNLYTDGLLFPIFTICSLKSEPQTFSLFFQLRSFVRLHTKFNMIVSIVYDKNIF